jgi:hypothetical protein
MDASEVEDAFFRYDEDFLEQSDRALSIAPSARLHILRTVAARVFGLDPDPEVEVAAARGLSCTAVDDSLISAVELFVGAGPRAASERFVEHCAEFPDDLLALYLRHGSLLTSGVRGDRARADASLEADAARFKGNWRFDPLLAMVRQEHHQYDDARDLAEQSLAAQPGCAPAAHALAHVNYETGEHAAGMAWLEGWSRGRSPLFFRTHFPWHNALHALALGEIDVALRCYREHIGPAAVVDAGSLLWRCRLWGAKVHEDGIAAAIAAAPVAASIPMPFAAFNACLALAAAGDAVELASMSSRLEKDDRPAFADLVAPVARALLAMVEDRPSDAVTLLRPLTEDLPRLGGSSAQREVVEDTMLRALVASGEYQNARDLLRRRLARRSHALDEHMLELVTAD